MQHVSPTLRLHVGLYIEPFSTFTLAWEGARRLSELSSTSFDHP